MFMHDGKLETLIEMVSVVSTGLEVWGLHAASLCEKWCIRAAILYAALCHLGGDFVFCSERRLAGSCSVWKYCFTGLN